MERNWLVFRGHSAGWFSITEEQADKYAEEGISVTHRDFPQGKAIERIGKLDGYCAVCRGVTDGGTKFCFCDC